MASAVYRTILYEGGWGVTHHGATTEPLCHQGGGLRRRPMPGDARRPREPLQQKSLGALLMILLGDDASSSSSRLRQTIAQELRLKFEFANPAARLVM